MSRRSLSCLGRSPALGFGDCGYVPLKGSFGTSETSLLQIATSQRARFVGPMVAKHRIMPAFNIQIRVVTCSHERMDNLRPIGLPKAGKPMLSDARVANPVGLQ